MSTVPAQKVAVSFSPDPDELDRNHRRYLNRAHRKAAELHHRRHMREHFQPGAIAKYGYAPRSAAYQRRKKRLYGHNLPLVYTGNTRRTILSQRTIVATARYARLTMRIPITGGSGRFLDAKALQRMGRKPLSRAQIDGQEKILTRIAELETISTDEQYAIAAEIEREYLKLTDAAGRPRVVQFH